MKLFFHSESLSIKTFFLICFFTGLSSSNCSEESDNCKFRDWFGDINRNFLFSFPALPGVSFDLNLFMTGVDFTTGDSFFPDGDLGERDLEDNGEDRGLRVEISKADF